VVVTQTVEPSSDRTARAATISRRQKDKFALRRAELASSALLTLSELGYARTSLREIAQNSTFSHGVLHYYFADKNDLIIHCVRQYKAICVTRYDRIVADAETAEELKQAFAAALADTVQVDASMHRLWYDLRSQSLFEPVLRADVTVIDKNLEQMIWRIVSRYAELADTDVAMSPAVTYALFDGLFQQALLQYLGGVPGAPERLRDEALFVLTNVLLSQPAAVAVGSPAQ
jgi:AcrR family transcriptional regulator